MRHQAISLESELTVRVIGQKCPGLRVVLQECCLEYYSARLLKDLHKD
jgi:hypothetical protein